MRGRRTTSTRKDALTSARSHLRPRSPSQTNQGDECWTAWPLATKSCAQYRRCIPRSLSDAGSDQQECSGPWARPQPQPSHLASERTGSRMRSGWQRRCRPARCRHRVSGTDEWLLEVGAAARAGVEAALLTQGGATASPVALEGSVGWARAYFEDDEAQALVERQANAASHVRDVATKPYPVSGIAQVPTELGCDLHEEQLGTAGPERIEGRRLGARAPVPGLGQPRAVPDLVRMH